MAEPLPDIDLAPILEAFATEAEELLTGFEAALVTLEHQPSPDAVRAVFRAAHSFKGNASSVGFESVAKLAHAAEALLEPVRDGRRALGPADVSLLLDTVDALRTMVATALDGQDALTPAQAQLVLRLQAAAEGGAAATSPATEAVGASEDASRTRTLRVDRSRLDALLDLAGELAIAHGRMRATLDRHRDRIPDAVHEAPLDAERLSLLLQEQVMRVRMAPVAPLLRHYRRTVREAARTHEKTARLELDAADVEIDSSVIEHLRDALVHLVRNAVAHGLEEPDLRARQGKDPCGTVTLRARREATALVLEIRDDGRGFDRARMIARARELGLEIGDAAPDAAVFELAFHPGFSTARSVDALAGRGVGMDVVRRNVEALRGSVTIDSAAGAGSTVTLRLPLTLALLDGLAVDVGGEPCLLPLDAVEECLDLPRSTQAAGHATDVISLRGEAVPYLSLGALFGLPSPGGRKSLVVSRHGGRRFALCVDGLLGQTRAVVKPLSRLLNRVDGVAGTALLPDGRVALVLDTAALWSRAVPFTSTLSRPHQDLA